MTKQDLRDIFFRNNYDEYKPNRFCKGGRYTLRHGEYERPDYSIRKEHGKDSYYIYCRYYFYSNTIGAPRNGRMPEDELAYLQCNLSHLI